METDIQSKDLINMAPAAVPPEQQPQPAPRRHIWVIFVLIGLILAGLGISLYLFMKQPKTHSNIHPYFSYSETDLDRLRNQSSTATITTNDIRKWADKTYEILENHGAIDVDASKIYAYLSVAQMDAAALSYKANGDFRGDIGLVTKDVLCEFYQDSCSSILVANDGYSKTLSSIILAKVKSRMSEDNAQTKPVTLKAGSQYWQGPSPQIGITAPSFKPWFITSADQFRVAPPVSPTSATAKDELATVKKMLASANNDEKAVVVKWAGGPGTRTPPGIWLTLADDYMREHNTPLDTYLETRAVLTTSMADAVIAVFDSKYFYQSKRPNMVDTSITTIMPTPNHPSYPAGHATISWAAATVLAKYLPNNKQEWERSAKEASDSRTIGGIHFPADNSAGTTLGINVGDEALKKWQE